jgi:hypothetical protein
MVRSLPARIALLAAAAAFIAATPAEAAAPRQPLETLVRHLPPPTPVDMDVWLRRLVGRFRWEGMLDTQPLQAPVDGSNLLRVQGMGDCVAVGQGPGVQCVLDVRWPEMWSLAGDPVAVPNLTPAMSLYGIDAVRERYVYLQVDNKGLAVGGPGTLYGATATLRAPCIGTNLPLQAPPSPGGTQPTSSDPDFSGGGSLGTDSTSSSDSSSAPDGNQAAAPAASRSAPINSITAEPAPWMRCLWTTRIIAEPDKDLIFINIDYGDRMDPTNRFTLTLRRIRNPRN